MPDLTAPVLCRGRAGSRGMPDTWRLSCWNWQAETIAVLQQQHHLGELVNGLPPPRATTPAGTASSLSGAPVSR